MAKYRVDIPFAGYISVDVEADDEDEARDIAWEKAGFSMKLDYPEIAEVPEVDTFDCLAKGNVCSAPLNHLTIEKLPDDD